MKQTHVQHIRIACYFEIICVFFSSFYSECLTPRCRIGIHQVIIIIVVRIHRTYDLPHRTGFVCFDEEEIKEHIQIKVKDVVALCT